MPAAGLETSPVLLGQHRRLFGIHTRGIPRRSPLALVTLNAGMLPSTGPYRLHVELAERLARSGFDTLRLDQSGKGESPARAGCTPAEAALRDYDDAFSYLHDGGAQSTVILGLCSGAVDALRIASERTSVRGLVLLDGYFEETIRSRLHMLAVRAFSAAAWSHRLRRLAGARDPSPDSIDDSVLRDRRNWESLAAMRDHYAECLERGVRILSIFSGGRYRYTYQGQLSDTIGPAARRLAFEEVYYQDADHLYTLLAHRRRLIDKVVAWLEANFHAPQPP